MDIINNPTVQNINQSREQNRVMVALSGDDEDSDGRRTSPRWFHGILRASARHLAAALRPVALVRDAGEEAEAAGRRSRPVDGRTPPDARGARHREICR